MKKSIFVLAGVVGFTVSAVADRFDEWDADKSGKLTRDELPERLRKNFDRVDSDKDGFITKAEHKAVASRNRPSNPRAGNLEPDGFEAILDVPYAATESPAQRLDLFVPKAKSDEARPLLVFIHGGGWRGGSKNGGFNRLRVFDPEERYIYASIGYRLSGEAKWPAQIHDCKAAIRWLRGNAEKYGIDPKKIAVHGTSAGGHLVAMLGVSGDVEELEGELGEHLEQSSRVTCVVNYFGPVNLLTMNDHPSRIDHDAPDSPESLLVGGPIQKVPEKARAASPISYITKDDAPTLTAHGTKDPLVPFAQGEEMEAALEKVGVVSIMIPMGDAGHGFKSEELNQRVAAFLQRYLVGNKEVPEISEEPISQ